MGTTGEEGREREGERNGGEGSPTNWLTFQCVQESLANAKVSVRQQCVYEGL